jgi:hypothetical protein
VTAIHRFDSALRHNLHFHILMPDGAWASTLAKTSHLLLAKTGHPPAARPGATPPQGGHGDDQEAVLCLSALVRA